MNDHKPTGRTDHAKAARQLAGLVAGPVAWAVHQNSSYMLVSWVCGGGTALAFAVVTLATIAVSGGAALLSFRAMPRGERPTKEPERSRYSRGRTLGAVSSASAVISTAGILLESVPMFILDPCGVVP